MLWMTFWTLQVLWQEFEFGEKVEPPEVPSTRFVRKAEDVLVYRDTFEGSPHTEPCGSISRPSDERSRIRFVLVGILLVESMLV